MLPIHLFVNKISVLDSSNAAFASLISTQKNRFLWWHFNVTILYCWRKKIFSSQSPFIWIFKLYYLPSKSEYQNQGIKILA